MGARSLSSSAAGGAGLAGGAFAVPDFGAAAFWAFWACGIANDPPATTAAAMTMTSLFMPDLRSHLAAVADLGDVVEPSGGGDEVELHHRLLHRLDDREQRREGLRADAAAHVGFRRPF